MKKKILFTSLVVISLILMLITSVNAQDKYFTRDGVISFFSSTPVEDIKAINSKVTCILDSESGDIEIAILMKAFEFKKALMEEHFNENYVESEIFPKATFKGKINNITEIDFSKDGKYKATVSGSMTIHGITKEITFEGTIEIIEGFVQITSDFNIKPEDYKIEIPSVVRDKIADEMLVSFNVKLSLFKR